MSEENVIDYRQLGQTGLRRFSGFVYEEFLRELTGWKAAAVYKEMGDNDPVVTSILYAIDKLVRQVKWRVEPASQEPYDKEAAQFLESCLDDMENTWVDTIAEILSMLQYGYSVHEICYKRRCGSSFDPTMRSKYDDGRIGWRCLPIRSQDTVYRWIFDPNGGIQGFEQLAPPHYNLTFIPVEKMLHFRTTIHKNNPEGRSILRGAYRPWYMKKNIENIEAIGIERDLAGLPIAYVPPEIMSSGASQSQKMILQSIKDIVTNVRRDEQEGIVMPMQYDATGKPMYDFKLLSTGGSRQFDTDKVIKRYDSRIAMCAMMDFLLIGHEAVGSFALSSSKTALAATAIGAFLDIIDQTFNRFAIPRLFQLNDFQISDYPKIKHGDIESVDLKELGDYIQKLSASGMPMFPNPELEDYLMEVANLPKMPQMLLNLDSSVVQPKPSSNQQPTEIPPNAPANIKPKEDEAMTNISGNTESLYPRSNVSFPGRKW